MQSMDLELTPEDAALLVRWSIGGRPSSPNFSALWSRIETHAALVPAPLNGDKVWGGLTVGLVHRNYNGNQARTIVRAKTKAEAIRMLESVRQKMSATHFNNYWGETGNREELALAKERGVWAQGAEGWVKVWPK